HTRFSRDWSSDVCSSDLAIEHVLEDPLLRRHLALLDDGGGMTGALQVVLRVPATGAAQDAAVRERQLAVGARADAKVIAIGPVVEIVPAAPSRPGEGGNLVALEAGLGEPCTAGDGDVGRLVLVRNSRRRAYREQRVRFQGELVVADVCRLEHERLLDVRERALHRLPGEREIG